MSAAIFSPRLLLGFSEFRAQRRDVYDSKKEGLPEFARKRTGTPSENAQKRDALDQMDDDEYPKECTTEAAQRARFEWRKKTGGGREPDPADDGFANRIDFFIFHFRGLRGGARMIASPCFCAARTESNEDMAVTNLGKPLGHWKADLESSASSSFSQGGEDGVLLRLFEQIGIRSRYFVEFGAWDGVTLSNTANLRLNHGWSGLLMESSDRADGVLVQREHVDAENVEALFRRYGVPRDFDLLSIDIDGNDYWVWKAIQSFSPRVVIVEYNIFFMPEIAKTIAYDPDHCWDRERYGLYHGASLAALEKLGREKGYALAYTEPYCPNAIFVQRDALPEGISLPPPSDWTRWDWHEEGYVEPPTQPGGRWVEV